MKDIIISGLLIFGMYQIYIRCSLFRKERELDNERHEVEMYTERKKQVEYFREILKYKFGAQILNQLPDYNAMINSNKPLVTNEWVEVDKLVNLN